MLQLLLASDLIEDDQCAWFDYKKIFLRLARASWKSLRISSSQFGTPLALQQSVP